MILTKNQIRDILYPYRKNSPINEYDDIIHYGNIDLIMKEVERLTREETRDAICNKLDDFLHPFIYGDKG